MAEPIEGFRLSVQQRRLWHLSQAGHCAHVQAVVGLTGALDAERLAAAIGTVVRRHDILRTRLHRVSGLFYPLQVVAETVEFDHRTVDGDRAAVEAVRTGQSTDEVVPWRSVLVRTGDEKAYLVLTLPAWSADAHSLGTIVTDIGTAYAGHLDADEPVQYVQFADWQQATLETGDPAAAAFWRSVTGRVGTLALPPFAAPGASGADPAVLSAATPIRLPEHVMAAVTAVAAQAGVPVEAVLVSCWAALLLRHQSGTEITLGAGLPGRPSAELAASIGPFSRRVPVPVSIAEGTTVLDVIAQVGQSVVRGHDLLDQYRPVEPPAPPPVGFETVPWPPDDVYDGVAFTVERLDVDIEGEQLVLRHRPGQADQLELRYDPAIIGPDAAAAIADQLVEAITTLTAQPDRPVRRLDLSTGESRRMLDAVNRTAVDHGPGSVLDRFAGWVSRTPAAPAVIGQDTTLSYVELDQRAAAVALALRAHGVGPESRVAVSHEHASGLLVAILGILRTGAAFVPLDPAWPAGRQHGILRDSGAIALVTQRSAQHPDDVAVVIPEDLAVATPPDGDAPVPTLPDNLAYIMYTSGSTGVPKGVAVTHAGLANYLAWCARSYRLGSGGSLVHTSIAFDLTLTGLLAPLLVGAPVRLAASAGIEPLARALDTSGPVSLLKLTPSHMDLLTRLRPEAEMGALAEDFIIGGEALTEQTLSFWRTHAPQTRLINEYGPTETVVGCITYTATTPSARPAVPIGRPIDNTRAYVVDTELNRVGLGVVGELYLGGAGVARGYHGRPDLTAERFVPDAFGAEPGGRLYRTGDLVRYLPSGDLEYIGRVDDQIQLHGFRVEPGDVEAALVRHPQVHSAAVVARGGRLLGYVTATGDERVDGAQVRGFVADRLPAYLVPASVTVLDRMPMTSNGKVDRTALPEPRAAKEPSSALGRNDAGGSTEEAIIAGIWRDALGLAEVGRNDNFFDLGAHSFLLVDVAARLQQQFGQEVSLLTLFEHPTVSSLARVIAEGSAGPGPRIDAPVAADDRAAQRRDATRRMGERQQRQEHEGL
jgi:nonribosomal peptide synthetase protein BlmX